MRYMFSLGMKTAAIFLNILILIDSLFSYKISYGHCACFWIISRTSSNMRMGYPIEECLITSVQTIVGRCDNHYTVN